MYNIIGYSSNRNLAIQSKLGIGTYFAMDTIIHFQSILWIGGYGFQRHFQQYIVAVSFVGGQKVSTKHHTENLTKHEP